MKRITAFLMLSVALLIVAISGAFLNLMAIGEGGDLPLDPPPIDPPSMNHSYYDTYVDIQSDTGAVELTKDADQTEILVPVRMYATNTTTYDGMSIEAFKNTIYFNPDYLEFVGLESGAWDVEDIEYGSSTCGHCTDQDSIDIEGTLETGSYTFPDDDWAVMYYIEFKILCVGDFETEIDLDITAGLVTENWLDITPGGVEEFDSWIEDPNDRDENEDGYVYFDNDYWCGFHIDTTEVFLGSSSTITVYCDSMNYHCGWFALYVVFDKTNFEAVTAGAGDLTQDWNIQIYNQGDHILVLGQVYSADIIEGVETTTSLCTITFKPVSGSATDDISTTLIFDTEDETQVKPGSCLHLQDDIAYGLEEGFLEIPKYEVDVTLDFIGEDKALGDYDTMVVYIKNSFPLGLRAENPGTETGGDLRILIEHAEELDFTDSWVTSNRVDLDIHNPNSSHVKVYLNPPDQTVGWLLPSTSPVELCRLEFRIPTDEDYPDWPPVLDADVIDSWSSYFTIASDTTGVDTMDMDTYGDLNQVGGQVDVAVVAEVYTEDVSGHITVDQPIKINTAVDLDSVYIHLVYSHPRLCIEGLTSETTGLEITGGYGHVYLHGTDLDITADDEILLGTVTFGSRVIPSTYNDNYFHVGTHVVDEDENLHYVVRTGGSVTLTTTALDACPTINIPKEATPNLPRQFALHQNYPNPFNPSTTIKFDLPSFQWVRLDIYNVLGRRVTTLVDSPMDAGYHEVIWNAGSEVASGVYFYAIQAGDFTEKKKMLLLK